MAKFKMKFPKSNKGEGYSLKCNSCCGSESEPITAEEICALLSGCTIIQDLSAATNELDIYVSGGTADVVMVDGTQTLIFENTSGGTFSIDITHFTCDDLADCDIITELSGSTVLAVSTSANTQDCKAIATIEFSNGQTIEFDVFDKSWILDCLPIDEILEDIAELSACTEELKSLIDDNEFTTGATLNDTTATFTTNSGNTYNLELSGLPFFECDDLSGCSIINDIQDSITAITTDIEDLSACTTALKDLTACTKNSIQDITWTPSTDTLTTINCDGDEKDIILTGGTDCHVSAITTSANTTDCKAIASVAFNDASKNFDFELYDYANIESCVINTINENLPKDNLITGATFNNDIITFTNCSGDSFDVNLSGISDLNCYLTGITCGGSASGGTTSNSTYNYELTPAQETEGSFSMNATTIKWQTSGSLTPSIDYIDNCITNGGEAVMTITYSDGNVANFTANAFINPVGTSPTTAYNGVGTNGITGKIRKLEIACSVASESNGGCWEITYHFNDSTKDFTADLSCLSACTVDTINTYSFNVSATTSSEVLSGETVTFQSSGGTVNVTNDGNVINFEVEKSDCLVYKTEIGCVSGCTVYKHDAYDCEGNFVSGGTWQNCPQVIKQPCEIAPPPIVNTIATTNAIGTVAVNGIVGKIKFDNLTAAQITSLKDSVVDCNGVIQLRVSYAAPNAVSKPFYIMIEHINNIITTSNSFEISFDWLESECELLNDGTGGVGNPNATANSVGFDTYTNLNSPFIMNGVTSLLVFCTNLATEESCEVTSGCCVDSTYDSTYFTITDNDDSANIGNSDTITFQSSGGTVDVNVEADGTVNFEVPTVEPCCQEITRTALITLRNNATLDTACTYVLSHSQGCLVDAKIYIKPTCADKLPHHVDVETSFDVELWEGRFDISSNVIFELNDQLGNRVSGDITSGLEVSRFPWGLPNVNNNVVRNANVYFDCDTTQNISYNTWESAAYTDLRGFQGVFAGNTTTSNARIYLNGTTTADVRFNQFTSYAYVYMNGIDDIYLRQNNISKNSYVRKFASTTTGRFTLINSLVARGDIRMYNGILYMNSVDVLSNGRIYSNNKGTTDIRYTTVSDYSYLDLDHQGDTLKRIWYSSFKSLSYLYQRNLNTDGFIYLYNHSQDSSTLDIISGVANITMSNNKQDSNGYIRLSDTEGTYRLTNNHLHSRGEIRLDAVKNAAVNIYYNTISDYTSRVWFNNVSGALTFQSNNVNSAGRLYVLNQTNTFIFNTSTITSDADVNFRNNESNTRTYYSDFKSVAQCNFDNNKGLIYHYGVSVDTRAELDYDNCDANITVYYSKLSGYRSMLDFNNATVRAYVYSSDFSSQSQVLLNGGQVDIRQSSMDSFARYQIDNGTATSRLWYSKIMSISRLVSTGYNYGVTLSTNATVNAGAFNFWRSFVAVGVHTLGANQNQRWEFGGNQGLL